MNEILTDGSKNTNGNTNSVHVTVNSFLIGFIDDVYFQFLYTGSDYMWVQM